MSKGGKITMKRVLILAVLVIFLVSGGDLYARKRRTHKKAKPAPAKVVKQPQKKVEKAPQLPATGQATAAKPKKEKKMGLWEWFMDKMNKGGTFMWFILLAGLYAIWGTIERSYALYYKYAINGKAFWEIIRKHVMTNNVRQAITTCEAKSQAALPQILKAALEHADGSEREIQDAVDEAALEVVPKLQKGLPYLSMTANVSTLLGLLGTILGLIQAFRSLAVATNQTQKSVMLAQGISIAMYTTAFGLIVAIPTLIVFTILQAKATAIMEDIDLYSVKLINLLVAKKGGK